MGKVAAGRCQCRRRATRARSCLRLGGEFIGQTLRCARLMLKRVAGPLQPFDPPGFVALDAGGGPGEAAAARKKPREALTRLQTECAEELLINPAR